MLFYAMLFYAIPGGDSHSGARGVGAGPASAGEGLSEEVSNQGLRACVFFAVAYVHNLAA